jgi:hypothetical protein
LTRGPARAVAEYLSVLDDAAFDAGRAEVDLSNRSGSPAHRLGQNSVAGYAYSDNYLIDLNDTRLPTPSGILPRRWPRRSRTSWTVAVVDGSRVVAMSSVTSKHDQAILAFRRRK